MGLYPVAGGVERAMFTMHSGDRLVSTLRPGAHLLAHIFAASGSGPSLLCSEMCHDDNLSLVSRPLSSMWKSGVALPRFWYSQRTTLSHPRTLRDEPKGICIFPYTTFAPFARTSPTVAGLPTRMPCMLSMFYHLVK